MLIGFVTHRVSLRTPRKRYKKCADAAEVTGSVKPRRRERGSMALARAISFSFGELAREIYQILDVNPLLVGPILALDG